MLLGGTVAGSWSSPEEWEQLLVASRFKAVTVCSAVLSVLCALSGILLSVLAGTPVGATVVAMDAAAFLFCCAAGEIRGGV